MWNDEYALIEALLIDPVAELARKGQEVNRCHGVMSGLVDMNKRGCEPGMRREHRSALSSVGAHPEAATLASSWVTEGDAAPYPR